MTNPPSNEAPRTLELSEAQPVVNRKPTGLSLLIGAFIGFMAGTLVCTLLALLGTGFLSKGSLIAGIIRLLLLLLPVIGAVSGTVFLGMRFGQRQVTPTRRVKVEGQFKTLYMSLTPAQHDQLSATLERSRKGRDTLIRYTSSHEIKEVQASAVQMLSLLRE